MRSDFPLRRLAIGATLAIALTFGAVACFGGGNSSTSPTSQPVATVTGKPIKSPKADRSPSPRPTKKPVSGGQFNKLFPSGGDGYSVTFQQEKAGFAEAKLKKSGKEVAVLSINDTNSNPSAADKFKSSSSKIGGYPSIQVGSSQTALLVGDRYQVKVRSVAPSFSVSDRTVWLKKFKLSKLETLK